MYSNKPLLLTYIYIYIERYNTMAASRGLHCPRHQGLPRMRRHSIKKITTTTTTTTTTK